MLLEVLKQELRAAWSQKSKLAIRLMIWDKILGQPEAIKQLRTAIDNERVSHAFLFWGPEGSGKKRAAQILAAVLNCPEGGCGSCLSCQKILQEIHPDVYQISPEGKILTIDQIRFLRHLTSLKLSEGKAKVFILDEVDQMNKEAANAFLKTLEEPPPSSFFILIASQLDDIRPTIISRCQTIRFRSVSADQIKAFLIKEKGQEEKKAELVSRISGGVLERALSLVESQEAEVMRDLVLGLLSELDKISVAKLLDMAALLISKAKDPLSSAKEKQEEELAEALEFAISNAHTSYLKKKYALRHKRELSRREQNVLSEIFSYCSSWYGDILLLKQSTGEELVRNLDYLEMLNAKSKSIDEGNILQALEIIIHAREMVQRNVNSQFAIESMLLKLQSLG